MLSVLGNVKPVASFPCRFLLLETYTTKEGGDLKLPDFLEVVKEVTDDPQYSMFQLSYKDPAPSSMRVILCCKVNFML